jgi:hypothetical protein
MDTPSNTTRVFRQARDLVRARLANGKARRIA